MTRPTSADRGLLAAGFALFLVGLLAGLATGFVANPRAGLAAHMEGLMNGMFLVLVGLAWPHLSLGRTEGLTRGLLVFGAWINLVGTELSAIFGTSQMTPIAGAGHTGPEWAELLVTVCLGLTVPTMIPATGLLIWGALAGRSSGG